MVDAGRQRELRSIADHASGFGEGPAVRDFAKAATPWALAPSLKSSNSAQSAKGLSDARNHYVAVRRLQKPQLHDVEEQKEAHERLETKKFCNTCRKQTAHKEVK